MSSIRILLAPFLLLAAPLAAAQWEDPQRLQQAAVEAVGDETARASIDPNTRVPRCRKAPEGRMRARNRSSASVEIACSQPAWRIYVPVRSGGRTAVAVLTRPVAAGEALRAADIEMTARDTASLGYGWFGAADDVVGRRLRRSLGAGHTLSPGDIERARLVATGDRVTIISRARGIEVRMPGQAMAAGGRDDVVRVRNTQSGREVEATVVATGTVEVSP